VVEDRLEELSLKYGPDIRDNNNDPRMQWLFADKGKKIRTVVGYERKLFSRMTGSSCQSFRPPRLK